MRKEALQTIFLPMNASSLQRRIDAAQGRLPCDLILKNAHYLDVFSCEWRKGDLSILDGCIVGLEPGLKGVREVDLKGKWVAPGFIDAHVHIESSLLTPSRFQDAVLKCGTTTAICDPHELANVMGVKGIEYFLNAAQEMDLSLWVMLSSCVPATHMETNGGGTIHSQQLIALQNHPKAIGLAEVMNIPGVLNSDPDIIKKIQAFSGGGSLGRPLSRPLGRIDGHAPLLKGQALSAYASTGISSCHESSELEEAREKLTKGMAVWIREGSVAKDLKTLSPLLTLATSTSMGFCTDDRNPLDIESEGHIDFLVRSAIREGVRPEVAYRSASWSVARHYFLDVGSHRVGAVAPGYQADLVILEDAQTCTLKEVLKNGIWTSERETVNGGVLPQPENTIRAMIPEVIDFEGPKGRVNVIGVTEGKIITEARVKDSQAKGIAKLSVLERYGKGSKPANAYVEGFGEALNGAITSSVGHDSHNLIAVGSNAQDMRIGMVALIQGGGGFCVVQGGVVIAHLALPFGGLMSVQDSRSVKKALETLKEASRAIGCHLNEPFLQLAFLSLPVIPVLKLTDQGLVDVNLFKIIDVRA